MQRQQPISRQEALQRLSSPDQLDQAIAMTSPRAWIGLSGIGGPSGATGQLRGATGGRRTVRCPRPQANGLKEGRPRQHAYRHLLPGQLLTQTEGDDLFVPGLEVDGVDGNFVAVAPLVWSLLHVDVGLTLGQCHLDGVA